jgi:hypothetical protein
MTKVLTMVKPAVAGTGPISNASLLEQLPPELLHHVFEYALPNGITFSFRQTASIDGDEDWAVFVARGKHIRRALANKTDVRIYGTDCIDCADDCKYEVFPEEVHTGLLYVSKAIAREARGELRSSSAIVYINMPQLSSSARMSSVFRLLEDHTNLFPSNHHLCLAHLACPIASTFCAT